MSGGQPVSPVPWLKRWHSVQFDYCDIWWHVVEQPADRAVIATWSVPSFNLTRIHSYRPSDERVFMCACVCQALRVLWHCLMYSNSVVNPFIYHHASNDFRDGFRDVIHRACCSSCHRSNPPTSGSSLRKRGGRRTADEMRGVESADDGDYAVESRDCRMNLTSGLTVRAMSTNITTTGCISTACDRQIELDVMSSCSASAKAVAWSRRLNDAK